MSRQRLTDGTEVIPIVQCDCGLTGGCKKCHPFVHTPEMQKWDINMAEEGMEEYNQLLCEEDVVEPLSPDLREFYRKKGYKGY